MIPFIELKNVNYRYKKTGFEITDMSLKLFKEQCTILRGRNGSGKTTLSKLIMGIIEAQSGSIIVEGQDIHKNNLSDNARKIGYLFQNPDRHFFCSTAKEEIKFSLLHNGYNQSQAEEKANKLLERFGLSDKANSFPLKLSGGEKQRLALLAVFAANPPFYILDEPISGIDKGMKSSVIDMLKQFKSSGNGLCIITHDKTITQKLSDRVITMDAGRVIADEKS